MRRGRARRDLWMILPVLGWGIGCASPGQPRPPTLRLPQVVADLSAERVGAGVHLRWTTPSSTADNLPVRAPLSAVLCRQVTGKSDKERTCAEIQRLSVQPGPAEAEDLLPAFLASGPVSLVGYRVEILNGAGRSAGRSPEVYAAGGAAPEPVQSFVAVPVRGGVQLEWATGGARGGAVELDRTDMGAAGAAGAAPAGARMPGRPGGFADARRTHDAGSSKQLLEVHLRPDSVHGVEDVGGTIDRSAQKGTTYRYTAQRVQSTVLEGNRVMARSAPSAAVTVKVLDTFPPAAPVALEAAPGGGESAAIDLSWRPGVEADLAGYHVYRAERSDGGAGAEPWLRISTEVVPVPAFADTGVRSGVRYAYRVTAVDRAGNESAPGNEVQETPGTR